MERVDVREWGLAEPDMQRACDDAARDGHGLEIAEGQTVGWEERALYVDSGLDLLTEGWLVKTGSPNGGGTAGSFVQSKGIMAKEKRNDIKIHGRGGVRAVDWTKTATLCTIYGDRTHLSHRIDCWAGGRAVVLAGDDVVNDRMHVTGSPAETNCGGIRYVGGKGYRSRHCHVVSGDDAHQGVPVGNPNDPLFDMDIEDAVWEWPTGASTAARFMCLALANSAGDDTINMEASIRRVRFVNPFGNGGIMAVNLMNSNSSGVLDDVEFEGGYVDMSQSQARVLAQEVYVMGREGSGGVSNIRSRRTRVMNPRTKVLTVRGKCAQIDLGGLL